MTLPIKFRGRRLDNGEFFFGNGVYQYPPLSEEQKKLGLVSHTYIIGTEFPLLAKLWHPVDPESVAQLVGYDCDGREVYEGDALINERGDGFFAELVDAVLTDEGFLYADIPPEILKLKEAQS